MKKQILLSLFISSSLIINASDHVKSFNTKILQLALIELEKESHSRTAPLDQFKSNSNTTNPLDDADDKSPITHSLSIKDLHSKYPIQTIHRDDHFIHDFYHLPLNKLSLTSLDGLSTLPNFTQLKSLNFNNNELTHLDDGIFDTLLELQELFLANNKLTKLNPLVFKNLRKLNHLVLSNNQFKEIDPLTFENLQELNILDIENNQLTILNPNAFKHKSLLFLFLNGNELTPKTESALIAHFIISKIGCCLWMNKKTIDIQDHI